MSRTFRVETNRMGSLRVALAVLVVVAVILQQAQAGKLETKRGAQIMEEYMRSLREVC